MSDTNSVVDIAMLEGLKEMLGDNFTVMLDAYFSDCQARIDRLKEALQTQNLDTIKDEAHGIKGSSRNLGANPLAEICDVVEAQARNNDDSELEQKVTAIEQSFAAVCLELNKLRD